MIAPKKQLNGRIITFPILIFIAISFSFHQGCISLNSLKNCPPDISTLEQRVLESWQAKADRNWPKLYEFTSEAYRKEHPKNNFDQHVNVKILESRVKEVKPSETAPDVALVTVEFKVSSQFGIPFTFLDRDEKWVWENCNWYWDLASKK